MHLWLDWGIETKWSLEVSFYSSMKGKAINGQLLNYFHTSHLICSDRWPPLKQQNSLFWALIGTLGAKLNSEKTELARDLSILSVANKWYSLFYVLFVVLTSLNEDTFRAKLSEESDTAFTALEMEYLMWFCHFYNRVTSRHQCKFSDKSILKSFTKKNTLNERTEVPAQGKYIPCYSLHTNVRTTGLSYNKAHYLSI